MDLLQMLNDNQHLRWGDPDNPEDDDAVVYLCSAAADEITTLRATIEAKDADLTAMTSRYSRAAGDIASLEQELADCEDMVVKLIAMNADLRAELAAIDKAKQRQEPLIEKEQS